jgi:hypothetical protein
LNRNNKIGIVAAVIATIMIAVPAYLYWAYGTQESMYRRGLATPFWTSLKNGTETIVIRQGDTKTVDLELHYWKGLRTLLGVKFEEPDTEQGGLYNAPDGLEISFNLDGAYVHVDNGKITDMLSYRNVKLKEPSEIEQRPEGEDLVVAEIGNVTVSVSKDVPVGEYNFAIGTTDASVGSQYGGGSQSLIIQVVGELGG